MAFRRVLVLIQVGVASLHRRQAHSYKLNLSRQKAKVLVNITHFRFLLLFFSLFYYGKQIFFVVKVKMYVAICDNP